MLSMYCILGRSFSRHLSENACLCKKYTYCFCTHVFTFFNWVKLFHTFSDILLHFVLSFKLSTQLRVKISHTYWYLISLLDHFIYKLIERIILHCNSFDRDINPLSHNKFILYKIKIVMVIPMFPDSKIVERFSCCENKCLFGLLLH